MERLTVWNGKKWVLPQGKGSFRKIAERLAAYENTGLRPDQLAFSYLTKGRKDKNKISYFGERLTMHLCDTPAPNRDTVGDICMKITFCDDYDFCEGCPIKAMIDRLCEYEDIGLTPAGIEYLKSRSLIE